CFVLCSDTAAVRVHPLSLHDALPISFAGPSTRACPVGRPTCHPPRLLLVSNRRMAAFVLECNRSDWETRIPRRGTRTASDGHVRSEEHTSELQSPYDLVCRLLLEKKK